MRDASSQPRSCHGRKPGDAGERAGPDLGVGIVAIFHGVLGLHKLLGFLNHLPPEPSDTLLGAKPGRMRTQKLDPLGRGGPTPATFKHQPIRQDCSPKVYVLRGQRATPPPRNAARVSYRASRGSVTGPHPAPHWKLVRSGCAIELDQVPSLLTGLSPQPHSFTNGWVEVQDDITTP